MIKREVIKFLFLAYLIGYLFQTVFFFRPSEKIWLIFSMWAPTLAVLLSGSNVRATAFKSIKGFDLNLFPLAFVTGAIPYALVQLFLWRSGLGTLDSSLNVARLPLILLVNPIATGLLGALGEELGWRGYLQPELRKRFEPATCYLLVGIVWAYWHVPANLAGYNGVEHRILNTLVIFPLTVIATAYAFGWLRSKSKTIWPCVYLHGVINSVSNCWLVKANSELNEKLLILVMWLSVGAFFFFLIMRERRRSSRF
jgi:membrane protease YdiL (CAAX protease family)